MTYEFEISRADRVRSDNHRLGVSVAQLGAMLNVATARTALGGNTSIVSAYCLSTRKYTIC